MAKINNFWSSDRIDNWFSWNLDTKSRTIYLGSLNFDADSSEAGIDFSVAEYIIKALHILNDENKKKLIKIKMNNIGGDWFHGMAIYDAIRDSIAPVDIEVYGHAMSMGAVILQAGRQRLMHPNSALMIHDGTTGSGEMPAQSARNWSNYEEELRKRMYDIFSQRSGIYPSVWKTRCSHDRLYTPEQAVKEGLADKVLIPRRQIPVKRSTKKLLKK